MFESLHARESRPIVLLKRAMLAVVALCFVTASASGYRAYYQVRSLELKLDETTLHEGSLIRIDVSGSGRTSIDVRVELIQGARSETLSVQSMRGNEWASFDPRPRNASQSTPVTREHLAGFLNGPAKVRATATGRPQWMRLPPPTVREADVVIRRE